MHELRFSCVPGCTKCCDTEGFVYLSEADLVRAAEYVGMTPAEFDAYLRKDIEKWAHVVEISGAKVKQ